MTTKQEWTQAVEALSERTGATVETCEAVLADIQPAGTQTEREAMLKAFAEHAGISTELAEQVLSDVSDIQPPVVSHSPVKGLGEAERASILARLRKDVAKGATGTVKLVELREYSALPPNVALREREAGNE